MHGEDGPVVVFPVWVAAQVDQLVKWSWLRAQLAPVDPQAGAVLLSLQVEVGKWRSVVVPGRRARAAGSADGTCGGSVGGTSRDSGPSDAAALPAAPPLTSSEAADLLGITQRAVTRAAARGALTGRRIGRTWVLERDAVVAYRMRTRRT